MATLSEICNSSEHLAPHPTDDPLQGDYGALRGATSIVSKRATVHPMHHNTEGSEDSNAVLASLAHDARNMFTALSLYCDLLAEPGVLSSQAFHYAAELKIVSQAGAHLVGRLSAISEGKPNLPAVFSSPIEDLGLEVMRNEAMLAALAGSSIHLEAESLPCAGKPRLSSEDLTRILIHLTCNAIEAMPGGGRIRLTVQGAGGASFLSSTPESQRVLLCIQDDGPGVPAELLSKIFEPGFTTKDAGDTRARPQAVGLSQAAYARRGYGLSTIRSLVESASGAVTAISRPGRGLRIEIELPVMRRTCKQPTIREGSSLQC